MSSRQQLLLIAFHAGITFLVIVATMTLAILHDIDEQAVTALIGAGLGFAGGAAGGLGAVALYGNGHNGNGASGGGGK